MDKIEEPGVLIVGFEVRVLQCDVVGCNVLQCVAVCCSVMQWAAVGCCGLQCAVESNSVL